MGTVTLKDKTWLLLKSHVPEQNDACIFIKLCQFPEFYLLIAEGEKK